MFTLGGRKHWFCLFAALCAVVAALVGCHDHHHVHIAGGDVEGYAYFPYEDEWGNYPVYYNTGNDLILVTLYDADDIRYEFPLRDYLTGTTGYYGLLDVGPGWYFLTAEAQEYVEGPDITEYYWAESEDFQMRAYELHIWDFFLEYDRSEPGYQGSAALLSGLSQLGPGELEWEPDLERFHKLRLERFRQQMLRERPASLRLKTDTEQLEPAPASN